MLYSRIGQEYYSDHSGGVKTLSNPKKHPRLFTMKRYMPNFQRLAYDFIGPNTALPCFPVKAQMIDSRMVSEKCHAQLPIIFRAQSRMPPLTLCGHSWRVQMTRQMLEPLDKPQTCTYTKKTPLRLTHNVLSYMHYCDMTVEWLHIDCTKFCLKPKWLTKVC